MTHPTDEQLMAWLDADAGAVTRGDPVAVHIEACARCADVISGAAELGAAVKLWAEEAVPPLGEDFAEQVLDRALAEERVPAATAAPTSSTRDAGGARDNVVPLASRSKLWRALPAAPFVLAAAAAALFAVTHHLPSPPTGRFGSQGAEVASGSHARGNGAGTRGASGVATGATQNGIQSGATTDPGGSEVLAIDDDGRPVTYAVVQVPGERAGSTVAVVWIEDLKGGEVKPAEGPRSREGT